MLIQCLRYGRFMIKKNKHDICKSEDFIKKICESLRKHTMNIINFEKKKIILLTDKQQELNEKQKSSSYIC